MVTWPAANGQGHKIAQVRGDRGLGRRRRRRPASRPATELTVPAGELDYGTQYAFTVAAINDKGASSEAVAGLSNTVVPFTQAAAR